MEDYKIYVSPVAAEQIKKQLNKRNTPDGYLRWGIKGSGCSGFSYVLEFEDACPRKKDIVFDIEGVKIIIDIKSITYLNGCTLDWEKSLLKQGFKFINSNEKSKCGCGSSFSV